MLFDARRTMRACLAELVREARPLFSVLLWQKSAMGGIERCMLLYKAQELAFVEHRTAAFFQSDEFSLSVLSGVQTTFLEELGIGCREAALGRLNPMPLEARRNIAGHHVVRRSVSRATTVAQVFEFSRDRS